MTRLIYRETVLSSSMASDMVFGMNVTDSSLQNDDGDRRDRPVESSRYELKSVARALRLLELLATKGDDGLTVTEAATGLGASKSATFAMLQTLSNYGYVATFGHGPKHRLGPSVLRLADSQLRSMPLLDAVKPIMQALTDKTGWTSRLAEHEDGYPVFIDRIDGPGSIRFYTPLGIREMPHRSAAGKAILAELGDARVREIATATGLPERTRHTITNIESLLADLALVQARGFAIDDEEDDQGVLCVGATVCDRDGRPVAAVSITGLKSDVPDWKVQELGRVVRAHADQMSLAIGGHAWRAPNHSEDQL